MSHLTTEGAPAAVDAPGTESTDVAELYVTELEPAKLDELLTDIEALATSVEIVLKRYGAERAETPAPVTLGEARRLLVEGSVSGVQIRYRHAGQGWVDTLLRTPEATRLVRARS
jgi:hypothetical protein